MISDFEYEQLQAQYEARIERHNDEIEEHKETFRLLKAAEAERDAALAAGMGWMESWNELRSQQEAIDAVVDDLEAERDAALARAVEDEEALTDMHHRETELTLRVAELEQALRATADPAASWNISADPIHVARLQHFVDGVLRPDRNEAA